MDKSHVWSPGTEYIICECGDNFPNEKLLNFHLANDHVDVDTSLQCEYCPEIFPSAQLYEHHIKRHNVRKPENKPSENPKPYRCLSSPENEVKEKPKSPPVIKFKHLKKIDYVSLIQGPVLAQLEVAAEEVAETNTISSEEDEVRYYKCNVCHKIFASEEFYLRHYNKVHANMLTVENDTENNQEAPPEDQCNEEPLVSTESQDYCIEVYQGTEPIEEALTETIMEDVTEVSPKASEEVIYFKCDLCKVLIPSETAYNNHYSKKHGGGQLGFQLIEQDLERPYLPPPKPEEVEVHCDQCHRAFPSKHSFRLHYRRVHGRRGSGGVAGPRTHECDLCGQKCFSKAALEYHRRIHTGEKPFECSECLKRFRGQEHLRVHMRIHTGERPFKCTICSKTFMRLSALSRHNMVHTGEKRYSCTHCGKRFSQSNGLKAHVRCVHLKLPGPFRDRRKRNE